MELRATYRLLVVLLFVIGSNICLAQTSRFNTNGDWSTIVNWDTGIVPTSTDNVIIEGVNCTISSNAECNDIRLEVGTGLTINPDDTLTVNGSFDMENFVTISNSGRFIIKGDLRRDNNVKVTLGGNLEFAGSPEFQGGMQNPQ